MEMKSAPCGTTNIVANKHLQGQWRIYIAQSEWGIFRRSDLLKSLKELASDRKCTIGLARMGLLTDKTIACSRICSCKALSVKVKLKRKNLQTTHFNNQGLVLDSSVSPQHRSVYLGRDDTRTDGSKGPLAPALSVEMDPILASCFVSVLRQCGIFFARCLDTFCIISEHGVLLNETCGRNKHVKLIIHLMTESKLFSMEPDIRWSDMILPLWTNRLIIEDVFSWLSTLGGAYSSLGDYKISCAIQAGWLSVKQLQLAWTIGDPFLQSRCMVYLSQSLMQRGYFRLARKIIRKQYQFAVSSKPYDHRLVAMCEGVWSRLQYSQWKRKVDAGDHAIFKTVWLSTSSAKNGDSRLIK